MDSQPSIYIDGRKSGPVLLSNSQAGPSRNFSQPKALPKAHHLSFSPSLYSIIKRLVFCALAVQLVGDILSTAHYNALALCHCV